jgi:hypothetical protein
MSEPNLFEMYQRDRANLVGRMSSIADAAASANRRFTDEESNQVNELIDATKRLDQLAVVLGIAAFKDDTAQSVARFVAAVQPPPIVQRTQPLSSTKKAVRNKPSSKAFDDTVLLAINDCERSGRRYAKEMKSIFIDEYIARGFPISNAAPNASAYEHAAVRLWIFTMSRDDAEFYKWLIHERTDRLRRGDREKLAAFATGITSAPHPVTLSRIAWDYIQLIRIGYDCKYS